MRPHICLALLLAANCALPLVSAAPRKPAARKPAHTFVVRGDKFLMDGAPYQIISGEMHYPRVPRAYWADRFAKARAMGLNTITTYVFWNVHEPRPGVFDFSGNNDIAEYLREAQAAGLNVILRPGPYVCAEWELGGYPSWLLKDRALELRSMNPAYQAAARTWLKRLGKEVAPLLLKNGGPIIAIQVENEYGSFGNDQAYLQAAKDAIVDAGLGDTVLYTSNPVNDLGKGSLPGMPTVINFGTGSAQSSFAKLLTLRPDGPKMSGEYWAGWFDHWGDKHHVTDGAKEAAELDYMLSSGYSVSLYMFHGGTSFGFMAGSNSNGRNFQPDTTSYDYDGPLDEKGEPRDKFFAFQKVIAKATGKTPPPMPAASTRVAFAVAPTMLSASLWQNLPAPVTSKTLLTFEDLDQSYGYVLYRTLLAPGDGGTLSIEGLHDYAAIYVDQKPIGILDRRTATSPTLTIEIPRQTAAATLDILVENTGRVNFTRAIRTDRKGLTGAVTLGATATLAGTAPATWQIYSLPLAGPTDPARLHYTAAPCIGPCFFRAALTTPTPADTYLDTRGLHKGVLWVDAHPLGRFWSIGPQYTLYTPGPWLKKGETPIYFFDLQATETEALKTATEPVFGPTTSSRN